MRKSVSFLAFSVMSLFGSADELHAQNYPSKGLRIIVPFLPGGGGDIMARTIAPVMAEGLGQSITVENRAGAGTLIGSEYALKNPADGYTLLVTYPSFVISPALHNTTRFDPVRDFKAIGQTVAITMAFVVHPSLPVKTMRDLVTLARNRPREIAYGAGAGTGHYLLGEMLRLANNIQITPIPYQGSPQMLPAIIGGHISMALTNVVESAPFVAAGKLRPLAVTTATRDDTWPDVPTVRESGFPDLEAAAWGGFVVRTGTALSVITRLNHELVRAVQSPAVSGKLKSQSMTPTPGSAEQFGALIQSEYARYAQVIREVGIKAE